MLIITYQQLEGSIHSSLCGTLPGYHVGYILYTINWSCHDRREEDKLQSSNEHYTIIGWTPAYFKHQIKEQEMMT